MSKTTPFESRRLIVSIIGLLIVFLSACASQPRTDISLLPMYGGVEKTAKQKQADADYLKKADEYYADRRLASEKVAQAGWNYWYQGNWQTAMRRFNQSWLLDQENYSTYWGFSAILIAQDKFREAIEMGEIAVKLAPDNHKVLCDLAFSKGSYAYGSNLSRNEKQQHYQEALAMCEKAATLAPDEPCYARAIVLFYDGQYLAAWEKVKQAEELGLQHKQIFLDDLTKKMPRPGSL